VPYLCLNNLLLFGSSLQYVNQISNSNFGFLFFLTDESADAFKSLHNPLGSNGFTTGSPNG
jgi:hypothetical protein